MKMHLGDIIKEKAKERQKSIPDIADHLATGTRNLYKILKENNLKVDELLKISQFLNYDFFKEVNPLAAKEDVELHLVEDSEIEFREIKTGGKELTIRFDVKYNTENAENLGKFMMHVDAIGDKLGFKLT
ncbi:hypothetical protein OQZ33_04260 [Pedobacter sp. MC2016-05]|uniref:hypothetical protein n=1 Tax=Pedobacter sp. MC2016-05 TaxID=2994474 RepID=UPI0022483F66|nr:hypothetical protein [Pedobacter sp. MC2016-05]MCX2473539.1 hypothetical protein [Pedobacter sp. MC2016-05]